MRENKGITLIALIITILILLILAGVAINLIINGAIFSRGKEAEFKTKMQEYRETLFNYIAGKIAEDLDTDTNAINSGDALINVIELETVDDIKEEDIKINLSDIFSKIDYGYEDFIVVYHGELCYVSNQKIPNNENQEKWCREIGITILDGKVPEGIYVKNGKYELVKGIYMCTPNVAKGFNKNKTRYLNVTNDGYLTPGNWINKRVDESWYDYKNKQWANIVVETNGQETDYVWIPRYCYKLDQNAQRSDVKFIDVDNSYKDENGNVTTWEQLSSQGYKIPEAFRFGDKDLAGYWMTKYTAGETITPSKINYQMSGKKDKLTLKDFTFNTNAIDTSKIAKYTVALNGQIVRDDITSVSTPIVIDNVKAGVNNVNVTALNSNGEILGTTTKEYEPAIANIPDTSRFNQATTFYVTYDESGNEHSTVPVSQPAPDGWYDYSSSEWANIVTRNNEKETYFVWIPRYCYSLDQTNQRSNVKFLTGTSEEVPTGYKIPEAFKFNNVALTGYWMTKYTAGEETAAKFESEMTASDTSIRAFQITGLGVADGQTYNYYINGELKGTKNVSTGTFEYTGLTPNTTYSIVIEIRNTQTDEFLGVVAKQVKTVGPNEPNLMGFVADRTYYVTYDNEENEKVGGKISDEAPSDWYDYSNKKWANIVVTDGTVSNGTITGANTTTYLVWIPRYCYMLDQTNQRSKVQFIKNTGTEVPTGYQIPEAFTFNNTPLTGYWMTKYTAGN